MFRCQSLEKLILFWSQQWFQGFQHVSEKSRQDLGPHDHRSLCSVVKSHGFTYGPLLPQITWASQVENKDWHEDSKDREPLVVCLKKISWSQRFWSISILALNIFFFAPRSFSSWKIGPLAMWVLSELTKNWPLAKPRVLGGAIPVKQVDIFHHTGYRI